MKFSNDKATKLKPRSKGLFYDQQQRLAFKTTNRCFQLAMARHYIVRNILPGWPTSRGGQEKITSCSEFKRS